MAAAAESNANANAMAMDRVYRFQRHIYDLTRKYYLFGRDRVIADLDAGEGDLVLELGAGTARNLIKAARRYPKAHFFGVDISGEMLCTAATAIERRKLGARIRLARADATGFDGAALFGEPRFDRIMIAYSLSMIPAWEAVLRHALAALAPGGRLLVVDFGRLEGWPGWCRRALHAWLRRFHVSPRETLGATAAGLAAAGGLDFRQRRLLAGYDLCLEIRRPPREDSGVPNPKATGGAP
jgi:S-adenosylmethionine-diacylgycerolhomoserine-N-methlytransferase